MQPRSRWTDQEDTVTAGEESIPSRGFEDDSELRWLRRCLATTDLQKVCHMYAPSHKSKLIDAQEKSGSLTRRHSHLNSDQREGPCPP